ncbi:MAG: four-carbon acid sugar kinase family protein [Desulforhopalus sp.]
MDQPLQVAVIADDLTGAADTGVQFCPVVGPIHLTSDVDEEFTQTETEAGGLAVYTNSRHLGPKRAAEQVRRVASKILQLVPGLIYKKIDSCLRGNIGAEIDALLVESSATASFVAPAFPSQGRTTEHDIHMIDGIPVAETEIGKDPLFPVNESRLSLMLSHQSRMNVGHVDSRYLDKGLAATAMRVKELLAGGCCHLVFDASHQGHLDAIVTLKKTHFNKEKIVFTGSAGLAGSIARTMMQEAPVRPAMERPQIAKWLICCGSVSQVMSKQVTRLVHHTQWLHMELDPSQLAADSSQDFQPILQNLVEDQAQGDGVILSITGGADSGDLNLKPDLVVAGLAGVVSSMLISSSWQGLFLSGGDTAEAVLKATGAKGICLYEEILPGLMRGEIRGGSCHTLPVVTKAGAFGTGDTLIKLINILK